MVDTKKLLAQLVGSGLAGGLAGGALAGLLTGSNKGRRVAGSAMKLGGLALVAGVAYRVRDCRGGKPLARVLVSGSRLLTRCACSMPSRATWVVAS